MIVHSQSPLNAETERGDLAAQALTPSDAFYVRNHGDVPEIDPEAFSLRVDGAVERPLDLRLRSLREALPRHEVTATLQCAGNRRAGLLAVRDIPGEEPWGPGATGTATWGGYALADVLELAAVRAGAADVAFVGADAAFDAEPDQAFAGSIPLEKALQSEVLLADAMNGAPLPPAHGAPLRAVVPGYIGARSVKWLERIEVREAPSDGFFQAVAYRLLRPDEQPAPGRGQPLGEVALNSDILVPDDGARVPSGTLAMRGYAFAGGDRSIVRVDVSADDGEHWTPARLLEDQGRWAWRRWEADLRIEPGKHVLAVRAWDSAAATQPESAATVWNPKGYVNNAQGRVTIHAA